MKVLSLFDWMACWYEALIRAWIKIDAYYASEIDKYAIQIAMKNHPDIIQVWDVTQLKGEDFKDIDLLIGGSPCQGFSMAWKMLNFNDPRSKLFFEFVRLLKEIKPKYFLLENVKMKKEFSDKISEIMWCEPIEINSALVSAQNRKRLYWTNIEWITQPEDKGILLKDILETDVDERYYLSDKQIEMIGNWKGFERPLENVKTWEDKMWTLTTHTAKMSNGIKLVSMVNDELRIRKLTPIECERLQTMPDNYTEWVSDTQRYKMLGNGWTCDVIAHIFSFIK